MRRTQDEYLIGLNLIPELTPRRMTRLLAHLASPQAIWEASGKALASLPGFGALAAKVVASRSEEALDRELARSRKLGIQFLTCLDSGYPPLLRQIDTPPTVLYVRGNAMLNTTRTIAIVGTRRSSRYGRSVAEGLAEELGRRGIVVVSGLAIGIDAAAHRGALKAGAQTVAVLGAGFLYPCPACNSGLADAISKAGTLISEYPLSTRPAKWTFPRRNRVLAGLSRGIVVVEAPERSGALITARLALDQGREVFAVPGNITSTGSCGTNRLIQEGAKLVQTVDDILCELPGLVISETVSVADAKAAALTLSEAEQRVYDLIGLEPMHIDDIIARGDLSPGEAAHILLLLQINQLIQEVEGRRYIRTL
jgi:DNA processing protein